MKSGKADVAGHLARQPRRGRGNAALEQVAGRSRTCRRTARRSAAATPRRGCRRSRKRAAARPKSASSSSMVGTISDDALADGDLEHRLEVAGRRGQRHAVGAVGGVHRRRQRIDVGDDDRAAAVVRHGALEGAHQRHPARRRRDEDVKRHVRFPRSRPRHIGGRNAAPPSMPRDESRADEVGEPIGAEPGRRAKRDDIGGRDHVSGRQRAAGVQRPAGWRWRLGASAGRHALAPVPSAAAARAAASMMARQLRRRARHGARRSLPSSAASTRWRS